MDDAYKMMDEAVAKQRLYEYETAEMVEDYLTNQHDLAYLTPEMMAQLREIAEYARNVWVERHEQIQQRNNNALQEKVYERVWPSE